MFLIISELKITVTNVIDFLEIKALVEFLAGDSFQQRYFRSGDRFFDIGKHLL